MQIQIVCLQMLELGWNDLLVRHGGQLSVGQCKAALLGRAGHCPDAVSKLFFPIRNAGIILAFSISVFDWGWAILLGFKLTHLCRIGIIVAMFYF